MAGVVTYDSDRASHAQYIASSPTGRDIGALDQYSTNCSQDPRQNQTYFDFGNSHVDGGPTINVGLIDQKEGFGARSVVHDHYRINLMDDSARHPHGGLPLKKLSVVVPVYFNEGSLAPLFGELQEVEHQLLELDVELELIFVDDGSGDGSLGELLKIKAARPATRLIKLSRNFGAVHASKTGLQFITGDCYVVLAADCKTRRR